MKFPKLFGRKSSQEDDDDDDDFDDDIVDDAEADGGAETESSEGGESRAPADEDELVEGQNGSSGDDYDDDDFDDDFDDEDYEDGTRSRLLMAAIGGGVLVVFLAVGAGAWWFLGRTAPDAAQTQLPETGPSRVVLDIAPRPRSNQDRPAPSAGQQLSATETLDAMAAMSEGPGAGVVVTPIALSAFGNLPVAPAGAALSEAPDAALIEQSPVGPLPKIGEDGRKPWQVYARPQEAGDRDSPVAIIFSGLGMSPAATEAAIKYLPSEVSLAFNPYGTGLNDWVSAARRDGHEVFLALPMEPSDFPTRDPGPRALMTTISPAENLGRLDYVLSRLSGYVGVVTSMGSRFTLAEDQMRPVLQTLKRRGLMFIDAGTAAETVGPRLAAEFGLAAATVDLTVDVNPSRASINRQLLALENTAREKGGAIALARPYPITIAAIAEWSANLKTRAVKLAPASAIAGKPPTP